jgi:hypothetical protein
LLSVTQFVAELGWIQFFTHKHTDIKIDLCAGISWVTTYPMTHKLQCPELLLSPIKDDVQGLYRAIQIGFDIPEKLGCSTSQPMTGLMYQLWNSDYLSMPPIIDQIPANYYHWATLNPRGERAPILSVYSFLFEDEEPYRNEPYDHSPETRQLLDQFYAYLRSKYKSADEYLEQVVRNFYLNRGQLHCFIAVDLIHSIVFKSSIDQKKMTRE